MTFCLDKANAPFPKFTVTIIGNISGANPTATESPKRNAPIQSCFKKPLTSITIGTIININLSISQVNFLIPISKLVGSDAFSIIFAIDPKYVSFPVVQTIPTAVPLSILDPIKQILAASSIDDIS